jgi:hypothetical protein
MIEVKVERVVRLVENPNARVVLLHPRHGVSVALHHPAGGRGKVPNRFRRLLYSSPVRAVVDRFVF